MLFPENLSTLKTLFFMHHIRKTIKATFSPRLYFIFSLLMVTGIQTNAQCVIPNRDFESWFLVSTGIPYELPEFWTESVFANVGSRFRNGEGFFNKYDEPDARGGAILLRRTTQNANNGFIRFACDSVPDKMVGRYKFSGTNIAGDVDTLSILVHFSEAKDTLSQSDLHFGMWPERARYMQTIEPTDGFVNFEIDLTDLQDQKTDYATIQFVMRRKITFADEYATAVVDSLRFVYEDDPILSSPGPELRAAGARLFPNPVKNKLNIQPDQGYTGGLAVSIINGQGKTVFTQDYQHTPMVTLDMDKYSKGIYLVCLKETLSRRLSTYRIIKN